MDMGFWEKQAGTRDIHTLKSLQYHWGITFSYNRHPDDIHYIWIMEPKRLPKLEIVRRLFRRFSTSEFSKEEKVSAIGRIMTRLSTSMLSPSEIREAIARLVKRLK